VAFKEVGKLAFLAPKYELLQSKQLSAWMLWMLKAVAYEAGGGRPPGLKNSGQTLFSGQDQVAQKSCK